MTVAAARLPITRVWGSDLPDPSTAPGEPPVLAAFCIWPGGGVTTTTRRAVPDYLRARYYDPSTGQFISRDPAVAMTREPYAYVNDNPLNATDPSGLCNSEDPLGLNGFDPSCSNFLQPVKDAGDVTGLLQAWNRGDPDALGELAALVHHELRQGAQARPVA